MTGRFFADGTSLQTLSPPGDATELPLRQLRERARLPSEILQLVYERSVLRAAQDQNDKRGISMWRQRGASVAALDVGEELQVQRRFVFVRAVPWASCSTRTAP